MYPFRYFDDGLISYGPVPTDIWRRASAYIDRILKGAKPSELPVQHLRDNGYDASLLQPPAWRGVES